MREGISSKSLGESISSVFGLGVSTERWLVDAGGKLHQVELFFFGVLFGRRIAEDKKLIHYFETCYPGRTKPSQ